MPWHGQWEGQKISNGHRCLIGVRSLDQEIQSISRCLGVLIRQSSLCYSRNRVSRTSHSSPSSCETGRHWKSRLPLSQDLEAPLAAHGNQNMPRSSLSARLSTCQNQSSSTFKKSTGMLSLDLASTIGRKEGRRIQMFDAIERSSLELCWTG